MTELPSSSEAGALASHYGPLVFRAAYRVLGDASLAEDVQQEVFLRLLESRRDGIGSWPAYLTTAAVRLAIDTLRGRQRGWRALLQWRDQAPTAAASAEQAGVDAQRAQQLRAALRALPRREAQCFGLRYLQGLEIGAIAAALSLSENNVGVILHRARRRLETMLADSAPEQQA